MVVGEVATGTDVLVVGGGPGGYTAALRAADLGRSVTLVERHRLGGVCLNVGCIPSKALIEAAHLAGLPARAARTGVALTAAVDMVETQRWISGVVEGLTADVDGLLRRAGVTVVRGDAHFGASRRVAVTHDKGGTATSFFEYQSAVVATGSRPMALPGVPFDGVRVLDSTAALALTELPTEMVVVGGGYIGVELGGAFAQLGVGVTIVEMADRLLPGMPASLAAVLERALVAGGVRVRPGTKVLGLDGDRLAVCAREGGSEETLAAPVVVVAVGREPNTAGMGLEATGAAVDPARGLIDVDPSRRAARGVYAIGDVTAGPALAHKATAEAEVAARACAGLRAAFDPSVIPEVVFSDPEIATVGATTEDATGAGADDVSLRLPLAASGRARILGATGGHVEIVADRGAGGTVLGVHMVGAGVSELAAAAALAVEMGATAEDLALTIAPHPTLSESLAAAARRSFKRG